MKLKGLCVNLTINIQFFMDFVIYLITIVVLVTKLCVMKEIKLI